MKFIALNEYEGCFELYLEAETMGDAQTLARLGINKTKELRHCSTHFPKAGTGSPSLSLVLGKKKNSNSSL